jgi:hypothetical protein
MKIESQDKRIDELLKGNIFLIPRFQREYSWEADQVTTFWSDITDNFGQAYFIGAMVVYKVQRSTIAVVDGQQRITTITILLCAIRDAFKNLGQDNLAEGLQAYIEQKDRENKTVYVLKTETSFPYLQENVLKSGPAEIDIDIGREEEAIQRAFCIFSENIGNRVAEFQGNKEQVPEENVKDATKWLMELRDTVFDLNLILVTLDNEDDAYLIFETLNTRGKDLALADLLRNHFTKFLKPRGEVDIAKLSWTRVLDTIKSSPVQLDPDTFIVHSWQSRFDFATKARVFQKVKERVTEKNAKSHLDRFVSDAERWRSIFDTDYAWNKNERSVQRSLKALRVFKVVQPTPGILSLVRAYRDGLIKYRALRTSLDAIEKFHFSFNAITSSRSSGGISGMYASFGRQLYDADDANQAGKAITDLIKKLRGREVADSEFDAGFEQIIHTERHSSQRALVRYILSKVAEHEQQPHLGDSEELTIEHLHPQSAAKTDDDEAIIGQLGNLMLVDSKTNEKLSTNDFNQKKSILINAGYKLPDVLMNANEIDAEIIRQNTKRIAVLSRESIWRF